MSNNLLAFIIVIPSSCLLLARFGLFVQEKYFPTGQYGKSAVTGRVKVAGTSPGQPGQQVTYTSNNPDRAVRNAIACLLKDDEDEIIQVAEKAFSKKPELWSVLLQEIAKIPQNTLPLEILEQRWKTRYSALLRKNTADNDDLTTFYAILVWCSWYLHVVDGPLLKAAAWNAMGSAYHAIAKILPARTADCGSAAFYSYQCALKVYRQLTNTHDTLEQQVNILSLMGKVRAFGIEEEIDKVACYFSCLDCYEQAQALCSRNPTIGLNILFSVYIGLGDTCKALCDELPGESEWPQRARAAYSELLVLCQMQDPQNENARQIINGRLNNVRVS